MNPQTNPGLTQCIKIGVVLLSLVAPSRGSAEDVGGQIAALCPCSGPVSGGAWKNHGEYVNCVTAAVKDLQESGSIGNPGDARRLIGEASQSACGRKRVDTLPSVMGTVPPSGGTVALPGYGAVTFPESTFASEQQVTLRVTKDTETALQFDHSTDIFLLQERLDFELRILTGGQEPLLGASVELDIPDSLLAALPPNGEVKLFAQIREEDSEDEPGFDNFQLLDSVVDLATKKIAATLPWFAFTNLRRPDGISEAVLVIGVTPTKPAAPQKGEVVPRSAPGPPADVSGGGECLGASIGSPLSGNPPISRGFSDSPVRNPINSRNPRPHYGTDFKVPAGSDVLSATNGRVDRVTTQRDVAGVEKGFGQYVIIAGDAGQTLYAHLSGVMVSEGDLVTRGQVLGRSGGEPGAPGSGESTGPHLHFEYAPKGSLFEKGSRVDPVPCMGGDVDGSIEVRDNGSAADDAFAVYLNGGLICQTAIGASNTCATGRLRPGTATLTITAIVAPDNVGTYQISLSRGVTFDDGTLVRSGVLPQGGSATFGLVISADPTVAALMGNLVPKSYQEEPVVAINMGRLELVSPLGSSPRFLLTLPTAQGKAAAAIFSVSGRKVRAMELGARPAGESYVDWDGNGEDGRRAGSGVYFLIVRGETTSIISRFLVVQ